MIGQEVNYHGPVGLDEEEAKNEHELVADESKDDLQPGSSSSTTDYSSTYDDLKDIENDKNAEEMDIPKDSFSMLYVGETRAEYILPIPVFLLQVSILVLILYNMLQDGKIMQLSNALNIPVAVPWTVTVSQYIACLVAVISADDLIQGMVFMCKRIIPSGYSQVDGELPPISWKWEFSNIMRFVEGLLVIGVSFVFIVQSPTVIDLFLNFAGVAFVGSLDDICFLLADNGLLGQRAKYTAKSVANFQVYKRDHGDLYKTMRIIRATVFVGMTVALWAGLSFVVWQQATMVHACQSLTVSVGESAYPWARHYGGIYARSKETYNHRAKYEKKEGVYEIASIAYSENNRRWAVYYNISELNFDLMSERTTAYDIKEVEEFRFWTDEAAEADVRCSDCDPNLPRESCSWLGKCNETTKSCDCNNGFFGDRCQHVGPCTEMVMDVGFEGCFSEKDCNDQKSFDLLRDDEGNPVMWLGVPVYFHEESSRYMFFDGNYWNVMQVDYGSSDDISDHLSSYLWDKEKYRIMYVSEPTQSSSPANLAFRAILADWEGEWDDDLNTGKTSAIARMSEKEFFFFCADCYNGTKASVGKASLCTGESGKVNYDICKTVENDRHGTVNRCDCPPGFGGPFCQIRPVEGAVTLHLDYGTGFCPICGEGNDWSLWDLDGTKKTCLPYPKKQPISFKGTNSTSKSQVQIGLSLTKTDFKVFVSINAEDGSDLCTPKEGTTKEIFTFSRIRANNQSRTSRIHFDKAIAFGDVAAPFGKIVDAEESHCTVESNVDQSFCDESEAVDRAWVKLDVKITTIDQVN